VAGGHQGRGIFANFYETIKIDQQCHGHSPDLENWVPGYPHYMPEDQLSRRLEGYETHGFNGIREAQKQRIIPYCVR
jgi:hypothetical protein